METWEQERLSHLARLARSAEHSFALAEGLTTATGGAFLRWLADYLTRTLNVDLALVGEFCGPDTDTLDVRAITRRDGARASSFVYDLRDSPLRDIATSETCLHRGAEDCARRYALANIEGIRAHAGVLLRDSEDLPIGILAVGHGEPLVDDEAVLATLRLFAARASGELELERATSQVRLLAGRGRELSAEDSLADLVNGVAQNMRVKIAFVAELVDPDRLVSRTVALSIDGKTQENFEYEMRGTPCEYVLQTPTAFYARGVQELFPRDRFLAEVEAEGYFSIAFFGPHGEPIGHLGVLHDRPLPEVVQQAPLLKALAIRARSALRARDADRRAASLEEMLLDLQELRTNRILVPGIVHDWSGLMTALLGNTSLLLERTRANDPMRRHLERIQVIGVRARELAGALSSYFLRTRVTLSRVDLNQLVSGTVDLLRVSLPSSVSLECDLADSQPHISGCPAELGQLVMNLVLNAVAACDTGDSVRVTTDTVQPSRSFLEKAVVGRTLPEGSFVSLCVQDTGCGIPSDVQSRMFEPHFTTRETGHGIGLAAVREIARRHRAAIHVTSAPGEGSTFQVVFALS